MKNIKAFPIALLLLFVSLTSFAGTTSDTTQTDLSFHPKNVSVVPTPPYNIKIKKLVNNDVALDTFEKTLTAKLGSVFKSSLPGGEAVTLVAKQLGIQKDVENAIETIVQAAIDKKSTKIPQASLVFNQLAQAMGVESFAIPVGMGGYKELSDKKKISIYLVIYDVASGSITYMVEHKYGLPSMLFVGFGISKDTIKKAAIAKTIDASNDIIKKMKSEFTM